MFKISFTVAAFWAFVIGIVSYWMGATGDQALVIAGCIFGIGFFMMLVVLGICHVGASADDYTR